MDVALGLHASAHLHGLHFIPLFQERYDFVIPQEQAGIPDAIAGYAANQCIPP